MRNDDEDGMRPTVPLDFGGNGDSDDVPTICPEFFEDDMPTIYPEFSGDDAPTICPEFFKGQRGAGRTVPDTRDTHPADEPDTERTRPLESDGLEQAADGETLRTLLERFPRGLGLAEAVGIVNQVVSLLARGRIFAVSPEMLFIGKDERVKLLPGVAPDVYYRAPEKPSRDGGERALVFSLGVVFHEAMTGKLPYARQEVRAKSQRQGAKAVKLHTRFRDHFNGVNRLFKRALAWDPEKRFQTLDEFCRALGRYRNYDF